MKNRGQNKQRGKWKECRNFKKKKKKLQKTIWIRMGERKERVR